MRDVQDGSPWLEAIRNKALFTQAMVLASMICSALVLLLLNISSVKHHEDDLQAMDVALEVEAVLNIVSLLVLTIAAVGWFAWLVEMHRTLEERFGKPLSYSKTWMVAAYLIPIVNWFYPLGHMKELWHTQQSAHHPEKLPAAITLWWVFWVVSNLTGNIQIPVGALLIKHELTHLHLYWASVPDCLTILAGVFAILIVRMTTARFATLREVDTRVGDVFT